MDVEKIRGAIERIDAWLHYKQHEGIPIDLDGLNDLYTVLEPARLVCDCQGMPEERKYHEYNPNMTQVENELLRNWDDGFNACRKDMLAYHLKETAKLKAEIAIWKSSIASARVCELCDKDEATLINELKDRIKRLEETLHVAINWLRRIEKEYPNCLNEGAIDKHLFPALTEGGR